MNTPVKFCLQCERTLPTSDYSKNKRQKDGLQIYCRECANQKNRDSYYRHREQRNASMKEYREQNPEIVKARQDDWVKRNPDRVKINRQRYSKTDKGIATQQRYNERHPEARRETQRNSKRKARQENPVKHRDYDRAYAKTPKGKATDKVNGQQKRSRKRNLPSNYAGQDWQDALNYFKGCCAVCSRSPGLWHTLAMDHWIPLTALDCPGTIPTNIVPLCHALKGGTGGCNNSKHNKPPEQWLIAKFGERKAKKILKRIHAYFASLK